MKTRLTTFLRDLQAHRLPDAQRTETVFRAIMNGELTAAQIAAVLMGLSVLGENADVITGAARAMRAAAVRIRPKCEGLLDTCGTGGDGASTFNISTTVAFVASACGVPVAKHGNRAISSKSGSADVLEALGVNIDLEPEQVCRCIEQIGIGFLFAPSHHPAMRHAGAVRRELGVRTVFNLLGPLTNPAGAPFQVLGVYAEDRLEPVAEALKQLGTRRALVVHGADGLDEITTTTITHAMLVEKDAPLQRFELDPAAFGMPYATPEALAGGDAATNAAIIRHILAGQHGAGRDIVLLNTAAALWITGKADGIPAGLELAAQAIDSGRALEKLQALADISQTMRSRR
ncbi:MAG: anthranilate phosphoribosyltransferase [Gammaproteobacteria bacterium]|nr:MAG: anthranilate phosphoribosyltransferase [Gammaproteobacteria bacterium]